MTLSFANPLDILARAHDDHIALCGLLEQIADTLPEPVDAPLARRAASFLSVDLPLHHRDEEDGLFPVLLNRCAHEEHPARLLAQLRADHATDEALGLEIAEILNARGPAGDDANAFGFMLRCFFECYRRHVLWEDRVVLPMARAILLETDLREIRRRMIIARL